MLLLHPRDARLNRFADGELGARPRARVARHLLHCERCRTAVTAIRELGRDARDLAVPTLRVELRSRVLSSVLAGEQVIVPIADPPPRVWRWERLVPASVGVLLVVGMLGVFLRPSTLRSEASSLAFQPEHPIAGSQVSVTYRATSRLARRNRLRLRAVYRRADDPPVVPSRTRETVASLARRPDGTFRGTFSLPPAAVYGLFAVEDDSGLVVDGRGRLGWEFLAAQPGGPTYDALLQKSYEAIGGDIRVALDAAVEATSVDPGRVEAWLARSIIEQRAFGDAASDTLRAFHMRQLRRLNDELGSQSVSPDVAGAMYFYAATWGADRIASQWRDWILREAPRSPIATELRTVSLMLAHGNAPADALDELERMWAGMPTPHVALPQNAFLLALRTGRAPDARRWAERWLEIEPWQRRVIAEDLLELPSLADEVLSMLTSESASLTTYDDATRPLYETVSQHRAWATGTRRAVLGLMGRAALQRGDPTAASAFLDSATVEGWDAAFFEDLADARLATRDSAGSAEMLARLAVDPARAGPGTTARGLALVDASTWAEMLTRARDRMISATLAEAQPRSLDRRVELLDRDGTKRDLLDLARGQVTVAAFFWPPCTSCVDDLALLAEAQRRIPNVFRIILISAERASDDAVGRLRTLGLDAPVVTDASGQAALALDSWGTAGYFVLDQRGTIQFSNTNLADIPRQAVALVQAPPTVF